LEIRGIGVGRLFVKPNMRSEQVEKIDAPPPKAETIDFSLRCVDTLVHKGYGVLDGVF
jgi:hypothetical protein